MTTDLDAIIQRISAGDTEGVERALVSLLRDNPQNADAWMLLATLYDDPSRKADCYRQVLHINPSNRRASIQLQALTNLPSKLPFQGKSSTERDQAMRCPQCGGAMEVQYIGEMRDKRAVCEYCNTEVDLPDSYQRVKKTRWKRQLLKHVATGKYPQKTQKHYRLKFRN